MSRAQNKNSLSSSSSNVRNIFWLSKLVRIGKSRHYTHYSDSDFYQQRLTSVKSNGFFLLLSAVYTVQILCLHLVCPSLPWVWVHLAHNGPSLLGPLSSTSPVCPSFIYLCLAHSQIHVIGPSLCLFLHVCLKLTDGR